MSYYADRADSRSLTTIVAVLIGVIVVVAIAYFAVWVPSQAQPSTVIVQPSAAGAPGAPGATGAAGAAGSQGATGAAGASGASGLEGEKGETGATGEEGATGQGGTTGTTGSTGTGVEPPVTPPGK